MIFHQQLYDLREDIIRLTEDIEYLSRFPEHNKLEILELTVELELKNKQLEEYQKNDDDYRRGYDYGYDFHLGNGNKPEHYLNHYEQMGFNAAGDDS